MKIENHKILLDDGADTGLEVLSNVGDFDGISFPKGISYSFFENKEPCVNSFYGEHNITGFTLPTRYKAYNLAKPYLAQKVTKYRNVLFIQRLVPVIPIVQYKNSPTFSNSSTFLFPSGVTYTPLVDKIITNVVRNKILIVPFFWSSGSVKEKFIDNYTSDIVDFSFFNYKLYYTDYKNKKYELINDYCNPSAAYLNANLITTKVANYYLQSSIPFEKFEEWTYPTSDLGSRATVVNKFTKHPEIEQQKPFVLSNDDVVRDNAGGFGARPTFSGSDYSDTTGYFESLAPRMTQTLAAQLNAPSSSTSICNLPLTAKSDFIKFINSIGLPYLTHLPTSWDDIEENTQVPVIKDNGQVDEAATPQSPANATHFDDNLNKLTDSKINTPDNDPGATISDTSIDPPADDTNKLPTINLFNRTFALTATEVRTLADELWNADDTKFEEIKNGLALMGGNPIQGLIDLRLYPIDFTQWTGTTEKIIVGRTTLDTSGRRIETSTIPQFTADLGTISGQYGNFMDFEPFSVFQIYLPFVGTNDLPANLVIGHSISAKASVDIITGAISYIVKADGYPILYKNGTIGVSIPMTADNAAEYAGNVIHATNNVVQTAGNTTKTIANDAAKATSLKGAITDPSSNIAGAVSTGVDVVTGASAIATAGYDLSTTLNSTTIQQSGTASPSNSLYTSMNVYILQEYHNPVIPNNYAHDIGNACRTSGSVGNFTGYTIFSNVDLTGVSCTESEKTIILETLQNGVYL